MKSYKTPRFDGLIKLKIQQKSTKPSKALSNSLKIVKSHEIHWPLLKHTKGQWNPRNSLESVRFHGNHMRLFDTIISISEHNEL